MPVGVGLGTAPGEEFTVEFINAIRDGGRGQGLQGTHDITKMAFLDDGNKIGDVAEFYKIVVQKGHRR